MNFSYPFIYKIITIVKCSITSALILPIMPHHQINEMKSYYACIIFSQVAQFTSFLLVNYTMDDVH